ncbi:hypothetical protein NHX12_005291 [Muraenolepis orangiensis]|uniref:Uncharacterized protein n=1 Tax=Muraenolepis orangiensis TaxID=630683 RepID=A0A9Q0DSW2_9TELE|nr:hypothetical protein NHX12_005291 [Muraenolepis orangiensis]
MSLSGAEIARRYRERCDADPERRRKYLETERAKWQKDREIGKKKAVKQRVKERTVPLEEPDGDATSAPDLRVVDSYGAWACLWESQFSALNIPHLRSHTLVHTDPFNKKALLDFVMREGRSAELQSLPDQGFIHDDHAFFSDTRLGRREQRRLHMTSSLKNNMAVSLPGTQLSLDFFKEQVERYQLDRVLLQGTVDSITPMANIPGWVERIAEDYPEERLRHTVSLMHHLASARHTGSSLGEGQVCEAGQRLMVIGGGLTSAHIVSIALQQGASHVTWVMRKYLQLKQFDVGDVEGLVGRYAHVEHGVKLDGRAYLGQFYGQKSLLRRLAMIRQARKGGAVTPEAYVQLKPFIHSGQVELKTYCQVSQARWCYRRQVWSVTLCSGVGWTGDRIWLATGCKLDARQDPLLSGVMKEYPVQSLQWAPGCPLYVMGQYSALQVGPHAVNLAGGQAASARIAADIMRRRGTRDVKKVERTVESVEQDEGVGAQVRRSIGRKELRNLDPFLMLDEFRLSKPAGFPDHPHRGFETGASLNPTRVFTSTDAMEGPLSEVTYVLEGCSAHEDFCGHSGRLSPGDLQWMTAGRGVVHAEMPVSEEPVVGLQLWVNLPGVQKMIEPSYQELRSRDVPKPSRGGVRVAVISGEALGAKSKVYTRTPTLYLDFTLQPGATHVQPVPAGWTTFVYTLSGSLNAGPEDLCQVVEPHHTVLFGDGDCVRTENKGSEEARFVLIAGEPIGEAVVQRGPFVMTTEEEISQAIRDYQSGRNGFERALTWRSQIRDGLP